MRGQPAGRGQLSPQQLAMHCNAKWITIGCNASRLVEIMFYTGLTKPKRFAYQ